MTAATVRGTVADVIDKTWCFIWKMWPKCWIVLYFRCMWKHSKSGCRLRLTSEHGAWRVKQDEWKVCPKFITEFLRSQYQFMCASQIRRRKREDDYVLQRLTRLTFTGRYCRAHCACEVNAVTAYKFWVCSCVQRGTMFWKPDAVNTASANIGPKFSWCSHHEQCIAEVNRTDANTEYSHLWQFHNSELLLAVMFPTWK